MKKLRNTLMLLLCLMLSAAAALGEPQCMYVDLPGDFAPYGGGWGLSEDGSVWVGGGFGTPGQTRGGLLRVSLDGSCADVTPEGDRMEGLYGEVIPLEGDSCIAVRSVRTENGYTDYLGRLDAGERAWQMEVPGSGPVHLCRIGDGFLMSCKPASGAVEIRRMDFSGGETWRIQLKERIVIEGMLAGEGWHVAYGMKYEEQHADGSGQNTTPVLLAFDDAGRLLWKWESARYDCHGFVAAAWREDGGVVALEQSGAIAFSPEGEVEWTYETDSRRRGLAAVEGGFLLASISGSGEVHAEFLDAGGALRREEYIPTGRNWSGCTPFISGGDAYVLLESIYAGSEGLGLMKLDAE
ncbi:MAG: hypothetical protein Q4G06_09410 [Clostridia bacterium]|nr:hypothetical protein [Clostridia bacterium]